jgi:methylmalonyl-CoA mutase C-terminal domain/subunit
MSEHRIRVLVAKPGLDGHDRGAKVIARALRDAGMEVIYTGLRQTPEMIAAAAVQEDVDAVSVPSSAALITRSVRASCNCFANRGWTTVWFWWAALCRKRYSKLKELGVAAVFLPGTSTDEIVNFLRENVKVRV